jgi:hypothetical protein
VSQNKSALNWTQGCVSYTVTQVKNPIARKLFLSRKSGWPNGPAYSSKMLQQQKSF